ncbi:molybdopterin molybdotransferase MoeA [Ursidibacter maritimus]|uniref:Molybdopterin molybdenumtransferase n=1 Tax=Ursidibacter maritimus TaxID=1331689 RepID=A0A949WNP4_9PAST|nr:molybdopterin molybdotransferase MoeA [Ursidibacter maritimus]KAE9541418.1 molybdopterin molybdenumtransferase MoeA [Ursidibacter maritimus]MBV6523849.1 molybdopterin molybdotransferase MoeA [Ursidibacter maritimus]MBV6526124.1 molybdopterin molybdotransferase MoeA [Ursidibacter maritimus]MBV6527164.1 molybdopterin molybdotransferase MoeA [Ursidibacter maritimus]MBV6529001.1 molybdopterin molybdotransferase MoeA [Ursidibacter maritimus]
MSLLPLSQALEQMLQELPTPNKIEQISLDQAANRILAEDIFSPINVPHFDNSAMDGYAVNLQNFSINQPLTVIGKAFAGNPFTDEIGEGQCVRIMTGAAIPKGTDAVVMQEETSLNNDGSVCLARQPKHLENIRQQGEDIQQGQLVLAKGSKLDVTTLPLLASLGIAQVNVSPRIKVAILSTGDELVSVGNPLKSGQIYDTNRFAVCLMLEKLNCEITDYGILPDDPIQFENAFLKAQQHAEVLITSGGVSVGEADFTKDVLEKRGQIGFWKIAMKPGKPFAFGQLNSEDTDNKTWFFGLPGNPVSALVTFYQLVQPALMKLAGCSAEKIANFSPNLTAYVATPLKKAVGRQDFQRGFYRVNPQGELEVKPIGNQGSHIFSAFNESNCFIVLEQERGNVAQGEKVTIQPFNFLLK